MDAVVVLVYHEHVAFRVDGKARGSVDLAVAAAVISPIPYEFSGRLEHGDVVVVLVCNVDAFTSIDSDCRRQPELAVSVSEGRELAQVVFF